MIAQHRAGHWPAPRSRRGVALCALVTLGLGTACGGSHHSAGPSATATSTGTASVSPSTSPPATSSASTASSSSACTDTALASWSLSRLAAQTIVVPVDETDVAAVTPEVAAGVGGVILFGTRAPADLGQSLAQLSRAAPGGIAPFVMTDEEGGSVQRMANLVGSLPSARQMGATMTPAQIQARATEVGRRLLAAGVTMDLAPVADVDAGVGPNSTNPIGTRSFSGDEKTASADALAFATGLRAAGVVPVVKHFPGLGGVNANTDLNPAATQPWSVLQGNGLLPFVAAVRAGQPAIMVSNASVPGLTSLPASISRAVITDELRQRLGFTGLVVTDSLSAGALAKAGYPVPRAATSALVAGADLVLYGAAAKDVASVTAQTVAAVVAAVQSGQLPKTRLIDAVSHVLQAKHVAVCG